MSSSMKTMVLGQRVGDHSSFDLIQNRIDSLSGKMDKLINLQEKVLFRLDAKSSGIEKDEKENGQSQGQDVKEIYQEMSTIMSAVHQRSEIHAQKLEGMEKLVLSMQQVISFIGETVKSSRVMELMFKGPTASKGNKGKQVPKRKSSDTIKKPEKFQDHSKDGAEKTCLTPTAQKTMKPPDTPAISLKKQELLREEVQKLNRENAEKSAQQLSAVFLNPEADVPDPDSDSGLREDSRSSQEEGLGAEGDEEKVADEDVDVTEEVLHVREVVEEEVEEEYEEEEEEVEIEVEEESSESDNQNEQTDASDDCEATCPPSKTETDPTTELCVATGSFETEEVVGVEEYTNVLEVEEEEHQEQEENKEQNKEDEPEQEQEQEQEEEEEEEEDWAVFRADGVEFQFDLRERLAQERKKIKAETKEQQEPGDVKQYLIDTTPPPAAPFDHRVVSAKPNQISNFYTINWQEVLGGGRFGQVHKCVENSSGLTLAAKVIKARSQKEKEAVKNEIQVMNNLDHANLIQLYAAYESRNDIILVLEYVGGGELFDRIIDENYTLMELDAVVFIRQICEGLQHMHKMYILHLDLKPENILCVSRVTNKIKIIDFGLARIYKPREKLRVNFGTPEFLAPEVINYDFVSFNTDMWSLGVITYMLLSGLCPFLGDDDNETLNNILACQWNFEEQEFVDTSEEAKDFITRLLVVNKSWRMGASEALRHAWLSDASLHHKLNTKGASVARWLAAVVWPLRTKPPDPPWHERHVTTVEISESVARSAVCYLSFVCLTCKRLKPFGLVGIHKINTLLTVIYPNIPD
ncbi:myosin light chain kinase 2, skeletal/cardiac muscle isoform X2 [Phyllopteryx taeniolatus]|uniref:myosin light chain kinase 2, skeletal/cardiac muscle isoform X2 n=1 Tax=Phyllopteryx taeniolatus TaxID=161469 RepID=UPI002AD2E028|nr:myosin light chain kinase 2, skeletal/cardiac muscle isoform X2 [Phyllopteryx taeniolatus]